MILSLFAAYGLCALSCSLQLPPAPVDASYSFFSFSPAPGTAPAPAMGGMPGMPGAGLPAGVPPASPFLPASPFTPDASSLSQPQGPASGFPPSTPLSSSGRLTIKVPKPALQKVLQQQKTTGEPASSPLPPAAPSTGLLGPTSPLVPLMPGPASPLLAGSLSGEEATEVVLSPVPPSTGAIPSLTTSSLLDSSSLELSSTPMASAATEEAASEPGSPSQSQPDGEEGPNVRTCAPCAVRVVHIVSLFVLTALCRNGR